jgi:hypothetical protein
VIPARVAHLRALAPDGAGRGVMVAWPRADLPAAEGPRVDVDAIAAAVVARLRAAPAPAPAPAGADKLKAQFGAREREAIAARAAAEGVAVGLWLRAVVGESIRLGRRPEAAPAPGPDARPLDWRCSTDDVTALDRARGPASRNAYLRAIVCARLNAG